MRKSVVAVWLVLGVVGLAAGGWFVMGGAAMHAGHHGAMGHDEVNMPGLQGRDTTPTEVSDLKALFQQHKDLRRAVENLPNGIKTVTETDNIALRAQLVSHVVLMLARVDTQRDPEVVIQSPSLTQIFQNSHAIDTEVEMSDKGVVVTQTSTDPMVVQLLQTHAAEVSDMSARGMQAVHQRMGDAGHQHQGGH
jgi:hypothetical protein